MKIEIKNRWTGKVIFSCEAGSMKLAVKAAHDMICAEYEKETEVKL